MKIKTNDVYTHEFVFTQDQVNTFAETSGDKNPIHIDAEFAAKTMFKKPIIHGFLSGSVFSKVFGTLFPGEGTIYLNQSMAFKAPMFVDTTYVAVFTVQEVITEKNRAKILTEIKDKETGAVTLSGEATVMNKEKF